MIGMHSQRNKNLYFLSNSNNTVRAVHSGMHREFVGVYTIITLIL
jgi:hypothetical protein